MPSNGVLMAISTPKRTNWSQPAASIYSFSGRINAYTRYAVTRMAMIRPTRSSPDIASATRFMPPAARVRARARARPRSPLEPPRPHRTRASEAVVAPPLGAWDALSGFLADQPELLRILSGHEFRSASVSRVD